ncbi:OmpA family protein [Pseudaestuariivita rosea]|uniref:OmpA family protein n=1 Tax=Pseudaestuariivita rosea TaxID=2763263 RepID=UPI001ABB5C48|nr:OmpA family protein [Pseudaestuariivita rosea]
MPKLIVYVISVFYLALAASLQAETDIKGSSDHPLISRYPGFYIETYKSREFDRAQMITSAFDNGEYDLTTVQGQVSNIKYLIENDALSGFQIFANYEKALNDLGAEILFSCFGQADCGGTDTDFYNESVGNSMLFGGEVIYFLNDFGIITAVVTQDDQQAHVMVVTGASNYDADRSVHQTIVTSASLDVDKIGIGTIEDVSAAMTQTGTVVLEGVFFETGTAELNPRSNETLDTTAAYLSENPDLQFYVVGHTDWDGSYDFNLNLSEERAKAVADALMSRGVGADRLIAVGIGPVAPNATNTDEEGRAANRRVELVLHK